MRDQMRKMKGLLCLFTPSQAVFYEIYVRAFCDTSGSGNGDLVGLTSKLDYLRELGVDCIWLLPIYPSPLKDDGYDVADYSNIHSEYASICQIPPSLAEYFFFGVRFF
jgi:1,4-alpha-glucan branching enzyme